MVRTQITQPKLAILLGAALLAGAAPLVLLAAPPQAKSTSPAKPSATSSAKPGKSAKKKPKRARAQKAPTPDRIREIQSALAQKGFYTGEPSGKWDARTIQAMKDLQQANGLAVTGKLDAKSLQKLGLGSEVAGAAAPRAPTNDPKPQPLRP